MILIILFVIILISFYFYSTKNHNYWLKRNVKHDPPIPLFGNHFRNQLGIKSITELSVELYNKYSEEKVIGYYCGRTPELIIKDLDLIRHILTVDFAYFYRRGTGRKSNVEPLFANVFHSDGDTWKLLRHRMTPAFTTAKLRGMFPLVVRCAERLQAAAGDGGACDAREMMARFTTEFIGACGFGIDMDTINNERSHFRELGKQIFARPLKNRILWPLWELFPELRNFIYVGEQSIEDAITVIVEKIREQREYKPAGRNDFIDLLLELAAKGRIQGESIERRNPDGSPIPVEMEMDLKCMVAQVFVFFAAGFETSSSATSFTLHELAFNPDVQSKIQEEIDEVMTRHDNKLCYDSLSEMTLLEMAFKEGMRMFPSLGILNRVCARRYTLPGLDITLDPGVKIVIPVQAIHMDEKYYDNPKEFRLDRFTSDAVQARQNFSYLPFGDGPRACIVEDLVVFQWCYEADRTTLLGNSISPWIPFVEPYISKEYTIRSQQRNPAYPKCISEIDYYLQENI